MENSNVPQDKITTYANNRKAIYATDENGSYVIIASSGWNVEEAATKQALKELERLAGEAYDQAISGKFSPLFFHMYDRRMDLQTLAQAMGIFQWRVRRHFRPTTFAKLSDTMCARYADTLGISTRELCGLPERKADES
jgi:hypothetical protein